MLTIMDMSQIRLLMFLSRKHGAIHVFKRFLGSHHNHCFPQPNEAFPQLYVSFARLVLCQISDKMPGEMSGSMEVHGRSEFMSDRMDINQLLLIVHFNGC